MLLTVLLRLALLVLAPLLVAPVATAQPSASRATARTAPTGVDRAGFVIDSESITEHREFVHEDDGDSPPRAEAEFDEDPLISVDQNLGDSVISPFNPRLRRLMELMEQMKLDEGAVPRAGVLLLGGCAVGAPEARFERLQGAIPLGRRLPGCTDHVSDGPTGMTSPGDLRTLASEFQSPLRWRIAPFGPGEFGPPAPQ